MIKFVLMVLLFGASGYLGFQSAKVYQNKNNFFADLLSFTKSLKNEISFLKTDIFGILKKYEYKSMFNDFLIEYQKILNNKNISQTDIIEILDQNISLTEIQKNTISQMFFELGNIGYLEQIERLEYYTNFYNQEFEKSRDKSNKMEPFCKKMGFMMGSLLCIVLI
jgi:stage III sporulation protein AB